jgi:transposase
VTADKFNITEIAERAKTLLAAEKNLSPAFRAVVELLLTVIMLMAGRLSLNSKNSSKPPSTDPNREKKPGAAGKRKPGGQKDHIGKTLDPVPNPDEIIVIPVDQTTLPKGEYKDAGFEARQVVEIEMSRKVTEYRAQILKNQNGKKFRAPFPGEITQKIQYGNSVKVHACYLSLFQLLPYDRLADYFENQLKLPISAGTLCNFNQEAYDRLIKCGFDKRAKYELIKARLIHADETGININSKRLWLHCACSQFWTLFFPHEKRGTEAMILMGVLEKFKGIMVHDHWKPYYTFLLCLHALCNAHHLRELKFVEEALKRPWALKMKELLLEINEAVEKTAEKKVDEEAEAAYRKRYRQILKDGELESPPPPEKEGKKRGKVAKTKDRNLLERLRNYEDDVLRFMVVSYVPFTNNCGENDLRMTKVQQKISGCFRSMKGAQIFCLVRSYILTCQKNGISPTDAMKNLFNDTVPEFLTWTDLHEIQLTTAE